MAGGKRKENKMEYRKFDNVIVARIDKDEEILEQLMVIAIKENIKSRLLERSMISQSEYTRQTKRNIIQTASRGIMKLHH